ncbi:hypothetical protein LPC_0164 [Legionella pneumophila str. Corby]|nr:hypothetical protein LPC_0164 [Legionella pneumophila str. Corby]ADG23400.1 hypothetical protein lpa_00217 [Legionella pneumophila 2300/99 Alcoy]
MSLQLIKRCFSWSFVGYKMPQKSPTILKFCPSGAPKAHSKIGNIGLLFIQQLW